MWLQWLPFLSVSRCLVSSTACPSLVRASFQGLSSFKALLRYSRSVLGKYTDLSELGICHFCSICVVLVIRIAYSKEAFSKRLAHCSFKSQLAVPVA